MTFLSTETFHPLKCLTFLWWWNCCKKTFRGAIMNTEALMMVFSSQGWMTTQPLLLQQLWTQFSLLVLWKGAQKHKRSRLQYHANKHRIEIHGKKWCQPIFTCFLKVSIQDAWQLQVQSMKKCTEQKWRLVRNHLSWWRCQEKALLFYNIFQTCNFKKQMVTLILLTIIKFS